MKKTQITFEPVKTIKTYEAVYIQIKKLIDDGELKPGEALPAEKKMMIQFGVSQPTLREALRKLEQEGLTTVVQGGATVVREKNTDYICRIFSDLLKLNKVSVDECKEFYINMLPKYCQLAMYRAEDEDIQELFRITEKLIEEKECLELFIENILIFYHGIMKSCHNNLLYMMDNVFLDYISEIYINPMIEKDVLLLIEYNQKLIDAIINHDTEKINYYSLKSLKLFFDENNLCNKKLKIGNPRKDKVKKATPVKAIDAIYSQIKDKILDGEIETGNILPSERSLVKSFGRSRVIIREAIKKLESDGFVKVMPGKGTICCGISAETILNPLNKYVVNNELFLNLGEVNRVRNTAILELAKKKNVTCEGIETLEDIITEFRHAGLNQEKLEFTENFLNNVALMTDNKVFEIVNSVFNGVTYKNIDVEKTDWCAISSILSNIIMYLKDSGNQAADLLIDELYRKLLNGKK